MKFFYFPSQKIDSHTDITYSASTGGGGGLVKSRDFVNLRCWHLCRDGKIIEDFDVNTPPQSRLSTVTEISSLHNDDSDDPCILKPNDSCSPSGSLDSNPTNLQRSALSKSLGAQDFGGSDHEEDLYSDAQSDVIVPIAANSVPTISTTMPSTAQLNATNKHLTDDIKSGQNVYVSAAVSIDYAGSPINPKYIRWVLLLPQHCWSGG
jgi:StAR-related lipid transfer protein 3